MSSGAPEIFRSFCIPYIQIGLRRFSPGALASAQSAGRQTASHYVFRNRMRSKWLGFGSLGRDELLLEPNDCIASAP